MDKSRLTKLVSAGIEAGVCDARILNRLSAVSSIEAGSVPRDNLVHTYRRRLKRTSPGSQLHSETKSLVEFLEDHQDDTLVMMSISLEDGGSELFLMDSDSKKILYWMRMFSR